MSDKGLKSQKFEPQPISQQQALDKARATIIKVLSNNEKQKLEIEDQGQELKEVMCLTHLRLNYHTNSSDPSQAVKKKSRSLRAF